MVSPTAFQDGGKDSAGLQDVFHTPPEENSLHSSDEHRPSVAADVGICAVNYAIVASDGSQGFVDFGRCSDEVEFADLVKESDLGFSEGQIGDAEMVADLEGDRVTGKGLKRKLDDTVVPETELSDSGDFSVKKLKKSEHDLGFGTSRNYIGDESKKCEESAENREREVVCDSETEAPSDLGADFEHKENVLYPEENSGSGSDSDSETEAASDFEPEIMENDEAGKSPCAANENKSSEEVLKGTKGEHGGAAKLRILPPSISAVAYREEKRLEPKERKVKEKSSPFTIRKFLAHNSDEAETTSILELLRRDRVTFPCPRWWPENYDSLGYFNTLGLQLTRDDSWMG